LDAVLNPRKLQLYVFEYYCSVREKEYKYYRMTRLMPMMHDVEAIHTIIIELHCINVNLRRLVLQSIVC